MGSLDKQKTGSSTSIDADVMEYKGGWAANTNTPTLSNSDTDVNGNTYRVTTAGSTDFGAGAISFDVGDLVINNGSIWEKFDSTYTDAQIKAAVDNELTGSTVGTTDTQTLTNKTIDADNNTITNIDNDEIKSNAGISFSKLETVGTDHIIGRTASGSGVVTGLSASQVRALLNVEDGATADQSDAEIKTAYENNTDTNAYTDSEKTKLSGIEAGATADQTGAEIKSLYEAESNTNAYTDSEKTKLSNIEDNATANPNAFDKTTETLDDITAGTTNKHFTASDESKLDGIENNATADMSDSEIKTAYENNANTNAYTDSEKSKLSGIESGAEVNDVTSVNSQTGAVTLDPDDLDDTSTAHKFATASQLTKLDGIETGATADQSASEIKTAYESNTNTNAFTDTEKSKLSGIESNATQDQTDSEIETAYNNQVAVASQAEAEAGTLTSVRRFTPERIKQAIDALAGGGGGTWDEEKILDGFYTITPVASGTLYNVDDLDVSVISGGLYEVECFITNVHNGNTLLAGLDVFLYGDGASVQSRGTNIAYQNTTMTENDFDEASSGGLFNISGSAIAKSDNYRASFKGLFYANNSGAITLRARVDDITNSPVIEFGMGSYIKIKKIN